MGLKTLSHIYDFVKADTATAAGTDDVITSDSVKVNGADSVLCIVDLGTITALGSAVMQVTECNTIDGSFTSIAGATATAINDDVAEDDSNKLLMVEVKQPKSVYLQVTVTRADENVEINTILCIVQRTATSFPQTQSSQAAAPVVVFG